MSMPRMLIHSSLAVRLLLLAAFAPIFTGCAGLQQPLVDRGNEVASLKDLEPIRPQVSTTAQPSPDTGWILRLDPLHGAVGSTIMVEARHESNANPQPPAVELRAGSAHRAPRPGQPSPQCIRWPRKSRDLAALS